MPSLAQLINAGSTLPKAGGDENRHRKANPAQDPHRHNLLAGGSLRQRSPLQLQGQPAEQANPQRLTDKQASHNAQRQERRQPGKGDPLQ